MPAYITQSDVHFASSAPRKQMFYWPFFVATVVIFHPKTLNGVRNMSSISTLLTDDRQNVRTDGRSYSRGIILQPNYIWSSG